MESYLKIPVTFRQKGSSPTFERAGIEESVRQFIELLITTKQGECFFNNDFGYEIWSNEFEPLQNTMQWQPKFMEQVEYLLERYENRITDVQVQEPEIKSLHKSRKSDKDYRITLTIDYRIKISGEPQNNIKISFDY
jgi:phage baseplate assembly protein W